MNKSHWCVVSHRDIATYRVILKMVKFGMLNKIEIRFPVHFLQYLKHYKSSNASLQCSGVAKVGAKRHFGLFAYPRLQCIETLSICY